MEQYAVWLEFSSLVFHPEIVCLQSFCIVIWPLNAVVAESIGEGLLGFLFNMNT